MGCNPPVAQSILDAKADHADIKRYFRTAPSNEVERSQTFDKDHGRREIRIDTVSHEVDWMTRECSCPGAFRFPSLTTIATVESRIERCDKVETERRSYTSSRILSAAAFAHAVRSFWAIENNLHWTLQPRLALSSSTPRLPSVGDEHLACCSCSRLKLCVEHKASRRRASFDNVTRPLKSFRLAQLPSIRAPEL
jgi:predicted transposase YbfD/YdcC